MIIFQHEYHPDLNLSLYDFFLIPLLMLFVYMFAVYVRTKNIKNHPYYKYFTKAIMIKVVVSVIFAATVLVFYPGDSMAYFRNINCLNKLLFVDSAKYCDILLNGPKPEYWSYFNQDTGYPAGYMWRDSNAIFVARLYSPIMLITYNNYILSTIFAGLVGFSGIWKLYELFCRLYPHLTKQFAFAILFFPSLIFWSAGLMKDTLTMAAIGWFIYSFYYFAIQRKYRLRHVVVIIISAVIVINIKAYIFAAIIPGLFVWFFFGQLNSIKSNVLKLLIAPVLALIVVGVFSLVLSQLAETMGEYGSVETALQKAQLTQQDLTRSEQYGENYYDIGKFEATPTGVLRKFPIATVSGIFRPFIWEASNPFMLLAGFESLFTLLFLIYAVYKTGLIIFFKNVLSDPILIFSFTFIIIFGFGVGLATANFGALVRYKIPLLPFFLSSLFILASRLNEIKKS